MMRFAASTLLALFFVPGASAHRTDEYLQATLIDLTPSGVDVQVDLTPGVAVLPVIMTVIDQNADGAISREEQRAYANRVATDLELWIDGQKTALTLIDSRFPSLEQMRAGLGMIRLKLHATSAGHELRFENRHLPQVSVYLVNCVAEPAAGLMIAKQERDPAQRSIRFDYSFGKSGSAPVGVAWFPWEKFFLAGVAILLAARMVFIRIRAREVKASVDR
jgi:hypothetical protein